MADLRARCTINAKTGCWIWNDSSSGHRYGRATWFGVRAYVHRIAYQLEHGPILDDLTVDHLCFTPKCANPEHLRLLTHSDNAKNQQSTLADSCSRGHPKTPENIRMIHGRRSCRQCACDAKNAARARDVEGARAKRREYNARNREAINARQRVYIVGWRARRQADSPNPILKEPR